mmetsp:Transcript_2699/g.6299  ORF Transcript_2699/g.6299 Transcript_2699/m.6299 type:complete len:257 (-) Transcript_2699:73-843(-)
MGGPDNTGALRHCNHRRRPELDAGHASIFAGRFVVVVLYPPDHRSLQTLSVGHPRRYPLVGRRQRVRPKGPRGDPLQPRRRLPHGTGPRHGPEGRELLLGNERLPCNTPSREERPERRRRQLQGIDQGAAGTEPGRSPVEGVAELRPGRDGPGTPRARTLEPAGVPRSPHRHLSGHGRRQVQAPDGVGGVGGPVGRGGDGRHLWRDARPPAGPRLGPWLQGSHFEGWAELHSREPWVRGDRADRGLNEQRKATKRN